MIIIYSIIAILVLLFLIANHITKIAFKPKTENLQESYQKGVSSNYFDEKFYENLEKSDFYIDSDYSYTLHGIWISNNSKKTIIISHGYTASSSRSIRYVEMFYKQGFNVLLYDQPYHGKSGGKFCSMGYFEKFDLMKMVDFVTYQCGDDSIIGCHGESMGAATILMHAAIDKRIDFLIADCPFQSAYSQFKYRIKITTHLPGYILLPIICFITKIKYHFSIKQTSPIQSIEDVTIPTLFIYGEDDLYIPTSHTEALFKKKTGIKTLYSCPNAKHALSFVTDKYEYIKQVYQFLDEINEKSSN